MPIGWPSAIAPPLTLTISSLTPRSRIDCTATAANASLISIRSRSATVMPCLDSAWLIAFDGCECSELSGPATLPCAPIRASTGAPSSAALRSDITTTAHAPSEICDADPAVIVPPAANAGRSRDNDSTVVSARIPSSAVNSIGSPRRCGIRTGTISSSNSPFFAATAARWCDCAANASCSSRLIPSRPLWCSVDSPIAMCSKLSVRPSKAIESRTSTAPYLYPVREPGSRCGALVIDSMPPATTTSTSPALISWSASAMASSPDRHTLLIVIDGTLIGIPAATEACREGSWPTPACSTSPMIT